VVVVLRFEHRPFPHPDDVARDGAVEFVRRPDANEAPDDLRRRRFLRGPAVVDGEEFVASFRLVDDDVGVLRQVPACSYRGLRGRR
jgi:hypothetical protein